MSVVQAVSIDYVHEEIHEGKHYTCSYSKAISAGSVLAIVVTTPASKDVHFTAGFQSSLSGTLIFAQNTTYSAGSALTVWNNKLSSSDNSGCTFVGTPTITTYGTAISTIVIGTNDKQTPIGGGMESRSEYILATSSTYVIYFTANATSTYSSINATFYVEG
jgi:hypothetical protein